MNSNPTPPRDLSPMWLDLSQVIAGLPVPVPAPRPADSPPRRGPPGDELPPEPAADAGPTLRWAWCVAAQVAGAAATAAMLMWMGLSPL